MRRLTRAAGMLTVLVGFVHISVGIVQYTWPSFDALWFYGSGISLLLIGALTLLSTSERAWGRLMVVALIANLLGVSLAGVFGMLSRWREPQGPILIALFLTGALGNVTSLKRAPQRSDK